MADSYFQEWYKDNKAELNKARRDRYAKDPEYKKRVLEANRSSRTRIRKSEKQAKEEAVRVKVGGTPWRSKEVAVDESTTEKLYSIGALASALGKSVQAIRLWERKGLIPETPHRTSKGDRLYSADMIKEIYEKLRALGKIREDKPRSVRGPVGTARSVRLASGEIRRVILFKIGVMAKAVGRTVVSIEQLEQRGLFPRTSLRSSGGSCRLYSAEMIKDVVDVLELFEHDVRGEEAWRSFFSEVCSRWNQSGFLGAEVVEETSHDATSKEASRQASADECPHCGSPLLGAENVQVLPERPGEDHGEG